MRSGSAGSGMRVCGKVEGFGVVVEVLGVEREEQDSGVRKCVEAEGLGVEREEEDCGMCEIWLMRKSVYIKNI